MKIPNLLHLFKPSRHLAGCFAVCINTRGVQLVHVLHGGPRPRVLRCSFHPSTQVTSPFLEKLRRDEHIGNFTFTTLLALGEYQMLLVEAPNVPENELKTAVRWSIKDNLNYAVEEATVDVLQVPSSNSGGDRTKMLYAVATQNATVQKRIKLFENAKIDLQVIDIPETAQRNIGTLLEEEGRGLALLSITDSGGLLTFTCAGELVLSRRIEITLGQLQDADEFQRQSYLDRVELEMQRSMDYFGRQFSYISLKRLLVSAPTELRLVQLLSATVDLPVEQLDLSEVLDISATPELADSEFAAHLLPALGAALRYEGRLP
jgi:MSHA biogenesis protein MshI